jgi:putative DNA primase/helicase
MSIFSMSAADLAIRYNLRHVPGRREWRGQCPACGYVDTFVLTERGGTPLLWCASCQDRAAMMALLRGTTFAGRRTAGEQPDTVKARQCSRERALSLWDGAESAIGSPADTYLAGRGLPELAHTDALRFRSYCPHPSRHWLPAMLALVVDVTGAPIGIHRTYLQHDGRGKADVDPVKASLGPVWGGAIRLHSIAAELVIGEGIESSASAGQLLGLPAWAAISAGNLACGLVLPAEVRTVIIAVDADDAGDRAARAAALRWAMEGRKVRIVRPNAAGIDFNDVLRGNV